MLKGYAKTIAMVLATVASIIIAALADHTVTTAEWINVGLAVVGVITTGVVPNLEAGIARYAKFAVAAAAAVLTALASAVEGGMTTAEWLQLLVVALGALGVVAAPGPKHPTVRPTPIT